jgi:hypothetical protein
MTYLDPLQLLELSIPHSGVPSAEDIRRAKRKLMAEFELAGTVTLHRLGRDIDRATALRAVESLEDPATLAHWVVLQRIPAVRAFLQDPQAKAIPQLSAVTSVPAGEFRDFVVRMLGGACEAWMDNAVRGEKWAATIGFLTQADWLELCDPHVALAPLAKYIRLMILDLKKMAHATAPELKQIWNPLAYAPELIATINALPDAMYDLRNKVAREMANAAEYCAFELAEEAPARILLDRAIRLKTDPITSQEVKELYDLLFQGAKTVIAETDRQSRIVSRIWVATQMIGPLIMLFFAMRRCAD